MKQNTAAWEDARLSTRNASEAAVVMGCAPTWWEVSKPAQLAAQKRTGLYGDGGAVTGHGHDLEPVARAALEERTGLILCPASVVELPYSASLDGLTLDREVWAEIKCPWRGEQAKTWVHGMAGDVEPHYHWQHVQQAHCSGSKTLLFYIYLADDRTILIERDGDALREDWPELEAAWESWAKEFDL